MESERVRNYAKEVLCQKLEPGYQEFLERVTNQWRFWSKFLSDDIRQGIACMLFSVGQGSKCRGHAGREQSAERICQAIVELFYEGDMDVIWTKLSFLNRIKNRWIRDFSAFNVRSQDIYAFKNLIVNVLLYRFLQEPDTIAFFFRSKGDWCDYYVSKKGHLAIEFPGRPLFSTINLVYRLADHERILRTKFRIKAEKFETVKVHHPCRVMPPDLLNRITGLVLERNQEQF